MRFRGAHLIAWVIVLLGLLALIESVDANSRGGGMKKKDVISDIEPSVRDIEERADIRWSISTAEQWSVEDDAACRKAGYHSGTYARCMYDRLAMRLLFMLRRDCTGLSAISEICGLEVK